MTEDELETRESEIITDILDLVGDLLHNFEVDDKKKEVIFDWDTVCDLKESWDEFQDYLQQGARFQ